MVKAITWKRNPDGNTKRILGLNPHGRIVDVIGKYDCLLPSYPKHPRRTGRMNGDSLH
jgi:hypothetical protein